MAKESIFTQIVNVGSPDIFSIDAYLFAHPQAITQFCFSLSLLNFIVFSIISAATVVSLMGSVSIRKQF